MFFAVISVLVIFGSVISAFPGEYVPKSYYLIDNEGHQSEAVPIRTKRDLMRPLLRSRRGGGSGANSQASAGAHSSSGGSGGGQYPSGGGGQYPYGGGEQYGYGDYNPAIMFPDFAEFAQNFPAAFGPPSGGGGGSRAGGAHSFASSHSSSSSGGGGHGGRSPGSAGGLGGGHDVGYKGPILFSRIGEDQGTGVDVSGSAQGPRGAFSSSSSAIDSTGKIKYSVQSGKY
ncbi:unnamed protein product [Phaedon cochleariae]|uniref:Uncharacterized protein n=1 Tax=Phaedon cochleariae TaxID=80249 RepID=A0A9P0DM08_PHACE|nr:unnamed protein product [Phaedon cochleariae]